MSASAGSTEPLAQNTSADDSYRVEYFEKPYRHYMIVPLGDDTPDPYPVLSVTTAIGVIDKSGPLQHYASNQTIAGVTKLRRFLLADGEDLPTSEEALKAALKAHKLMFYHRTADAAARGTDVHHVFEDWADNQTLPKRADYPDNRWPYIQGLAKWLVEARPEVQTTEQVVGSVVHGYAGRLDMTVKIKTADGTRLTDIKTAKNVYPRQHFPQLMAYEGASVEMGGDPTDTQSILLLTAAGSFREVLARDVSFPDFTVLLAAKKSQDAIPECATCWKQRCTCRRRGGGKKS